MNDRPTVFLVDDDPSILRANSRALQVAGYHVESYTSAAEFLKRPEPNGPGCIVIDLAMPGISGLQLQETIRSANSQLPVIFLSGQGDVRAAVRAMKAGAVDFLEKPVPFQQLLDAVSGSVARHRALIQAQDEAESISRRYTSLTPREKEVAVLVIRGLMNKQIAAQLGAAEKTVKIHRARVMRKLESNSVAELVRLLDRIGIR